MNSELLDLIKQLETEQRAKIQKINEDAREIIDDAKREAKETINAALELEVHTNQDSESLNASDSNTPSEQTMMEVRTAKKEEAVDILLKHIMDEVQ